MAIPGEVQSWDGVRKGLLRQSLAGVVPARIFERRVNADGTDLLNQAMEAEFVKVQNYLDNHRLAGRMGYLNSEIIRERLGFLKERVKGEDCLTAWSIRDILALEAWLEAFFGEDSKPGVRLAASTPDS